MDAPVKSEQDEPWYDRATDTVAAAAAETQPQPAKSAETSAVDAQLASSDFHERLCLAKIDEEDGTLWPALRYDSLTEFQLAVARDVKLPSAELGRLQRKIGLKGWDYDGGVAYLLGRGRIKGSLIPIGDGDAVEVFWLRINEIKGKDGYKDCRPFQMACQIARTRCEEMEEETDSSDDNTNPLVKSEEVEEAAPSDAVEAQTHDPVANSANESGGRPNTDERENGSEMGGENLEKGAERPNNGPTKSGEMSTSDGGENGSEGDKDTEPMTKKRSPANNGKKKEKKQKSTPKSKSKRAPAPVVTPGPTQREISEIIAREISPIDEPYTVMTDAEAWGLLEGKFGISRIEGKKHDRGEIYSINSPEGTENVRGPIANLRKDLCAKGLPESTGELSTQEKIDLARWVRYANVRGMEGGRRVDPADLGRPIKKFMDGWRVLTKNFGCGYASGKYTIRTSSSESGGTKKFEHTIDIESHFARFGIQCLPDHIPEETMNEKDRLSLEIYMATPRLEVLDTFKRIKTDNVGNVVLGKRKRTSRGGDIRISYR